MSRNDRQNINKLKISDGRNIDSAQNWSTGLPEWNEWTSRNAAFVLYLAQRILISPDKQDEEDVFFRGQVKTGLTGGSFATAAGSLRLSHLLVSRKTAAHSSSYTALPPSHRHFSVWENTQWNQRVNHCVGKRPANKDNLSALAGSSLPRLLQQQWQRNVCTATEVCLLSHGGAGWHWRSPLSQV